MWFVELVVSLVISFVLSQLLAPKPKSNAARPAGLGDFAFPTATEGRVVPILWGTTRIVSANVVWYGDLNAIPRTQNVKTSLINSEQVVVGFNYYVGFFAALCRGPIDSFRKIYWGEKVIWDVTTSPPPTTDPIPAITVSFPLLLGGPGNGGGVGGDIDLLFGAEDQPIDPYLAQFQQAPFGTIKTPGYHGTCGLVFKAFYVGDATTLQAMSAEVRRIPNGLGLDSTVAAVNQGNDCNPISVAYEIITNAEWGMKQSPASIDAASFTAAAITLASEGNGFSFLLDAPTVHDDLLSELERQIDGFFFVDPATGLWTVKLNRDDYDLGSLVSLDKATNVKEITSWVASTWSDTKNQVNLEYFDRAKNYQSTPAWAQDLANAQMQGGLSVLDARNVKQHVSYPGVKDADLANQLVWRDLRKLSRPRIAATIVTTRAFASAKIGDVVPFNGTVGSKSFSNLPLRVAKVDYGSLTDGKVTLYVSDDVAGTFPASGGAPPPTLWIDPALGVTGYVKKYLMVAPYGLNFRNDLNAQYHERFFVGAVPISGSLGFTIRIIAGGDPGTFIGGIYFDDSQTNFQNANAALKSDLPQGTTTGGTITLTAFSAVSRDAIFNSISVNNNGNTDDLGRILYNLILIEDEFVLFTDISIGTGNDLVLDGVYRAVLDTVQAPIHKAGVDVFFVSTSSAYRPTTLSASTLAGSASDAGVSRLGVALFPFTGGVDGRDVLSVPYTEVDNTWRAHRPCPPAQLTFNTVPDATTTILEGSGSGEAFAIAGSMIRRESTLIRDNVSEVDTLTTDASLLYVSQPFPATTNWQTVVSVYNDPLGANTLLYSLAASSAQAFTLLRDDILRYNQGILPTTIGVSILAQHTITDGGLFHARTPLLWVLGITSALTGQFAFGALANGVSSNLFTAAATGTHTFTLFSALPGSGHVQGSKNGGGFVDIIIAAGTTGTIALTAGDTLAIKHTSASTGFERFLSMTNPSSVASAFAVCYG